MEKSIKSMFSSDKKSYSALYARLALGIVMFPHGAQKLFGWFGGHGFSATMGFFTGTLHLPWIIGLLVILIEFFGSLALILGFFTRAAALGMFGNFIGIILSVHIHNGFFMNWASAANRPEGFEYHLLVLGLCLVSLFAGGGKCAMDSIITEFFNKNERSAVEDS